MLEYFDAFLIGLTATPTDQTIGFFNNNLVMEYGHEQAVADGVNVGFDVYRIRTRITEQGATLESEPGRFIARRDRRTRAKRYAELEDDLNYSATNSTATSWRRTRSAWYSHIQTTAVHRHLPGRTEVPKTLVFTKDDCHAEDFDADDPGRFGRGNDFAQKITYRTGFTLVREVIQDDGQCERDGMEKDLRSEARRGACRIPHLLQPPDRGNGGHDCHGHGCEAARMSAVHEEREERRPTSSR